MSEPNEIAAVTPALTPEEWTRSSHLIQCYDSWSDEWQSKTGVGEIWASADHLTLTGHQSTDLADFSAPSDRHALAALCLHGQPFGFTREDVALLRQPWHHDDCGALFALYDHNCECGVDPKVEALRAIADRLAALLPPEQP